LQLLLGLHLPHRPERGDHVMRALINVIRQLARLIDGGWLPLAILGLVVFWMMHSA
jgi:hypothetical protein